MAQVEQNLPNYYKIDEKLKKKKKNFCKNRKGQNFNQKKKCPKVLEKVVTARNLMSSIDWCKNFHDSKQHDDFYKTRTDGQTFKNYYFQIEIIKMGDILVFGQSKVTAHQ